MSNYKMTAEIIDNHLKKKLDYGNNITEFLRMLQVQNTTEWEPTLQTLDADNATIKEREDKQNTTNSNIKLN
jgi:hypothetical protein